MTCRMRLNTQPTARQTGQPSMMQSGVPVQAKWRRQSPSRADAFGKVEPKGLFATKGYVRYGCRHQPCEAFMAYQLGTFQAEKAGKYDKVGFAFLWFAILLCLSFWGSVAWFARTSGALN